MKKRLCLLLALVLTLFTLPTMAEVSPDKQLSFETDLPGILLLSPGGERVLPVTVDKAITSVEAAICLPASFAWQPEWAAEGPIATLSAKEKGTYGMSIYLTEDPAEAIIVKLLVDDAFSPVNADAPTGKLSASGETAAYYDEAITLGISGANVYTIKADESLRCLWGEWENNILPLIVSADAPTTGSILLVDPVNNTSITIPVTFHPLPVCTVCAGSGKVPCTQCNGRGYRFETVTYFNNTIQMECHKTQQIDCDACEEGLVVCTACNGTGSHK